MQRNNTIAIITGGASGIGKTTALMFAKRGTTVVICDVNEEDGKHALEELHAIDPDCLFFKVDVTKREEINKMVNSVMETFGRIDVLVNNAGIVKDALLIKMTGDQWDRVIDINLKGTFNCTQAVLPAMIQQKRGKVINTSSVVGVYGNVGQTNYAASKAGVIGLTKSWAKELGRKGITVNAIAPGYTMTDMMSTVPQKVLDLMAERTPMGRLGKPEDIANATIFLASPEADFINGAVLSVDGGMTI